MGRTLDGKAVVGGFHRLLESQGIPLQFFLQWCSENGVVPDWPGFVEDALAMNWGLSTTLARVEEATADIFGRDHAREVMDRLRRYVAGRNAGGVAIGPSPP